MNNIFYLKYSIIYSEYNHSNINIAYPTKNPNINSIKSAAPAVDKSSIKPNTEDIINNYNSSFNLVLINYSLIIPNIL